MTIRRGFETAGDRGLLITGGIAYAGNALLGAADRLGERLLAEGHRRILVASNDPRDIVLALAAHERLAVDVYIAHYSLAPDRIATLAANEAISGEIRGGELHGQRPVKPGAEARGRVMVMSSGTTGLPKIAVHSMASLAGRVRIQPGDDAQIWLLAYQPSSFAGLQVLLTATMNGYLLVHPSAGEPAAFLETILAHGVTHVSATPSFWRKLLMAGARGDATRSIRQISIGGEAVDDGLLKRLESSFPGVRITHIYASTEAGAVFAVHDGHSGFPSAWLDAKVGDVELRIESDELLIRSPRRMERYASQNGQAAPPDEWVHTGDLVAIHGDRVHFVGRKDSSLNIGGAKVSPEEIEAVILDVPGVLDARVSGVSSPITGAVLQAEVVMGEGLGEAELRKRIVSHARSRLTAYKVPRLIRFVPMIPLSSSGKKQRVSP